MKTVLLSFDIEEFDMPLEYGKQISFEDQIKVSREGTRIILDVLREHQISATFFSTAVFASHATDLIGRICSEGHELASHGYYHSSFERQHLRESKQALEKMSGVAVTGFRMPRMQSVDDEALREAGYSYNSSLNPVYLPGRYNNFFRPRTVFMAGGVTQLPASATPVARVPLFWLSFHNFPLWLYKTACAYTIKRDHYLNIYFHPWEFTDLTLPAYGLPSFVSKNSGNEMFERFTTWITWLKKQGYVFTSIARFIEQR